MRRKLFLLTSFVLVLGLVMSSIASAAPPGLIGWWKLDGDALDSSGLGNDGKIEGGPKFVPGKLGLALNLTGSQYVVIDAVADDITNNNITMCLWLKTSDNDAEVIACNSGSRGNVVRLAIDNAKACVDIGSPAGHSTTSVDDDQWHHVAYIRSGSEGHIYVDGVKESTSPAGFNFSATDLWSIGQEWDSGGPSGFLSPGTVDDVQIYDRPLTVEELQQVMAGIPPGVASEPHPENDAIDVPREVVLSWTPGEFAPPVNGHKVYLSESFNDVNDGIGGVMNDANSYAPPQRLNLSTTYYWRVDEINAPPDSTIFKGDVWSFTTELLAYPIENVTATASSAHQADMAPEKTIDGSGLDDNDLHSKEETDMWLSGPEPLGAWIEYQFDKVYKLHEMWVWNSNQMIEALIGFGLKDVTVEYSTNGTDWTTLAGVTQFARAPGADGYEHNITVDFGGAVAKYVKLTATSNWGGIMPQYGLSEVRFLHIPVSARKPYPDSGATGVPMDVVLSWHAGREAATHNVYVSTDEQAVIDRTAPVATVPEASYGPLSLDLGSTQYWRVDEVNEAETPNTWESNVWSFAVSDYVVVDDFESYNDLDPGDPASKRIFNVWIDGYEVPTNGSLVGYENPPFCEKTIVHDGKQSMPFFYTNTGGAAYSEAELTLSPSQNWTTGGAKVLSLWFHGDASNAAAQMYVKVNGTKVAYDGNAGNLALASWQVWNIDFASIGTNLQSVTKLAIGIDGSGASGTLFFDDIRLYALAPAPINEWRIADDADDVEERIGPNNGAMDMTSSDLEMPYEDENKVDPQIVGLRFTGIPIPKGATITEAWVRFQVDETKGGTQPVNLIIEGELSPNPAAFSSTAGDISKRTRTTAQVQWSVPNWTNVGDQGPDQTTPNIASIIQELVNQNGWAGSAIVLMIRDNPANPSLGVRCAEAGPDAVLLHISYQ